MPSFRLRPVFSLTLVALALFHSFVMYGAEPGAPSSVRILTYNVGLLRIGMFRELVKEVDRRAQTLPREIAEFAAHEKIDIISLQEVWEDRHADTIASELQARGYVIFRPKAGANTPKAMFESGLLVAIREEAFKTEVIRPETDVKFSLYSARAGLEATAKKGFATVPLVHRSSHNPLILGVTHMQALDVDPTGKTVNAAAANAHATQASELNALAAQETRNYAVPFVLAGDLNVGRKIGNDLYQKLTQVDALTFSAADLLAPEEKTWDRENRLVKAGSFPNDPSDVIDHVVFRSDGLNGSIALKPKRALVVFQDKEQPLSDHYGLLVDAEFVRIEK